MAFHLGWAFDRGDQNQGGF